MSTEDEGTRTERSEPETLRLSAISPSLTVGDVNVSLPWYRDVIGFTVDNVWEEEGKLLGAELKAGSMLLMIGQDDGAKGSDRVKGVGFRLYMTTDQDVDALAAAIESRGGTLESAPEDMPWGARAFSLLDPDGFAITIASKD
jgi:uncharacterized glyoxalase superfamily protein PhnB